MGATTVPKDYLPGAAAEEKGPIARREIFGTDTGAFMEIEISEDRQQAAIKTLSFCGDPALTAEDITLRAWRNSSGLSTACSRVLCENWPVVPRSHPTRSTAIS